jgi:hypothetical protein
MGHASRSAGNGTGGEDLQSNVGKDGRWSRSAGQAQRKKIVQDGEIMLEGMKFHRG